LRHADDGVDEDEEGHNTSVDPLLRHTGHDEGRKEHKRHEVEQVAHDEHVELDALRLAQLVGTVDVQAPCCLGWAQSTDGRRLEEVGHFVHRQGMAPGQPLLSCCIRFRKLRCYVTGIASLTRPILSHKHLALQKVCRRRLLVVAGWCGKSEGEKENKGVACFAQGLSLFVASLVE
jgi:hypothetical protein